VDFMRGQGFHGGCLAHYCMCKYGSLLPLRWHIVFTFFAGLRMVVSHVDECGA